MIKCSKCNKENEDESEYCSDCGNDLVNYDDSRSKSFFCISCTLLPLDKLIETHKFIDSLGESLVVNEKNKLLKEKLLLIANNLKIDLKLYNKK